MPLRQTRVVEIVGGVVGHAQLFHHPPQPPIRWNRESDDFRKLHVVESEAENGLSAFGSQALSPKLGAQEPADLDARSEMRFVGDVSHSNEADELAGGAQFGGEERESVLRLMGFDACYEGIGFFARERSRVEFHYARV